MAKKIAGVHAPHNKNTAAAVPQQIPTPKLVKISTSMHGGEPAVLIVSAGDQVKVGQLIGEAVGKVSSPIHASVSGTVKSIDRQDLLTGEITEKTISVTIESDGEQALYEGLAPPNVECLSDFLQAVSDSGVVGLGGAGYPTAPKLTLREGTQLDYILINGAECEPYITSDTRTMVDDAEYVYEGAKLMLHHLRPGKVVICIEENKPEAIAKMRSLCEGDPGLEVHVLPALYPQGERKVLVYNVTGRIVPEGGRLTDVGCIVINCTTAAVFARYIKTGMPLVSKIVTVDGSAVASPGNVIAPIGTPIRELFDFCGGFKEEPKKIIMGGPMMGAAVPNLDMPVVKVTNAVLALNAKDAQPPEQTPCIRCGMCISRCPMNLMPSYIENAFELKRADLLRDYKVNMCAECSCCAYLCPAKRPLSQVMMLAKQMLRGVK